MLQVLILKIKCIWFIETFKKIVINSYRNQLAFVTVRHFLSPLYNILVKGWMGATLKVESRNIRLECTWLIVTNTEANYDTELILIGCKIFFKFRPRIAWKVGIKNSISMLIRVNTLYIINCCTLYICLSVGQIKSHQK